MKVFTLWGSPPQFSCKKKHVEAFGDSLLVVQQVSKVFQYYNGSLNAYLDKCLDIISSFDEFVIRHLPREENGQANTLAQQASGYKVEKKKNSTLRNQCESKPSYKFSTNRSDRRLNRSDRPDRCDCPDD